MTKTQLRRANESRSIRAILTDKSIVDQIQRALPSHMDADRMARVAITATTKTPALLNCTPESFMRSLLDASALGLEPDGRMAHLIPYGADCKLIVDYKGLLDIAYRSGMVKSVHADVVHMHDIFVFSTGEVKEHVPWAFRTDVDKPKSKGDVYAAYCAITMQGGAYKHEVMDKAEIESIRARSQAGRSGPWVTDWSEMAKKTVFRRASKWIPMSSEMRVHFDSDFDSLPETRPSTASASRVRPLTLENLSGDAPESDLLIPAEPEPEPEPPKPAAKKKAPKKAPKKKPAQQPPLVAEPMEVVLDPKSPTYWEDRFQALGKGRDNALVTEAYAHIQACPDEQHRDLAMATATEYLGSGKLTRDEYDALEEFAASKAGT
jgi:recombination protein RecT